MNDMKIVLVVLSMALFLPPLGAQADGAKSYKRCAACHLKTGKGVPGSYPPINDRLAPLGAHEKGREYLVLVVKAGLMGPITVGKNKYRGIMPPQARLKPEKMAEILNYVMEELNGLKDDESWTAFSEAEIKAVLDKNPKIRARGVMKKRAGLFD